MYVKMLGVSFLLFLLRTLRYLKIDNEAVAIINHIRASLTDHLFLDKVDHNVYLLPFNNGILDLKNVAAGVRKATADEFVMKKCRYVFEKASAAEIDALKAKL